MRARARRLSSRGGGRRYRAAQGLGDEVRQGGGHPAGGKEAEAHAQGATGGEQGRGEQGEGAGGQLRRGAEAAEDGGVPAAALQEGGEDGPGPEQRQQEREEAQLPDEAVEVAQGLRQLGRGLLVGLHPEAGRGLPPQTPKPGQGLLLGPGPQVHQQAGA